MFSLKDYCNSKEGMRFLANTALLCYAVAGFNYEHNQQDTFYFLWRCDPTRVMAS
jgi:hypothetical protein